MRWELSHPKLTKNAVTQQGRKKPPKDLFDRMWLITVILNYIISVVRTLFILTWSLEWPYMNYQDHARNTQAFGWNIPDLAWNTPDLAWIIQDPSKTLHESSKITHGNCPNHSLGGLMKYLVPCKYPKVQFICSELAMHLWGCVSSGLHRRTVKSYILPIELHAQIVVIKLQETSIS